FAHGNRARSLEGAQGWHELEAHRYGIWTRQEHNLGALPSILSVKHPDFMDPFGARRNWTRCFDISGLHTVILFFGMRDSPELPFRHLGLSRRGVGFLARRADWPRHATLPAETDRTKVN